MLRAHARQIRIGKWLSTVRTPSNTARILISYFYADDVMGMAYLKKKHTTDGDSSSQASIHPKKDVK